MRSDLEAENRAIMKHWGKREKQLNLVLQSTVTMYGEFQVIAGASLPAIQGLELPTLEAGAEAEEEDESAAS